MALEDIRLNLKMVTDIPEKDDNGISTRKTIAEILPKSTRDNGLFIDDIFRHQKVNLGNCRRWSRHLVRAVPAAATSGQSTEINPTGLSNIINHVRQLDLREAEKEISVEEINERDLEEKEGKQLPKIDKRKLAGYPEILENLYRAYQTNTQDKKREIFDNLAALMDENVQRQDKSIRRKMLNWVDDLVQEHYGEKIGQTYRRELEEGNQFSSSNAEREQQKREEYLCRDKKRKTIKGRFDAFWEERREEKETLREKEEERFEKWAAEHGVGVSNSTPDEPKKRMSAREKGFLRAKESLNRLYSNAVPTTA